MFIYISRLLFVHERIIVEAHQALNQRRIDELR